MTVSGLFGSPKSRLATLVILLTALFVGGYAASAATTPQSGVKVCVNKKTGVMRQASTCTKLENTVTLQAAGTGDVRLVTKHVFPIQPSDQNIAGVSPECPATTPALVGNEVFMPKNSVFSLSAMTADGWRGIRSSGNSFGRVVYSKEDGSISIRVSLIPVGTAPRPAKIEIYTITTCAPLTQAKTINY
jgi:hypothetical protein